MDSWIMLNDTWQVQSFTFALKYEMSHRTLALLLLSYWNTVINSTVPQYLSSNGTLITTSLCIFNLTNFLFKKSCMLGLSPFNVSTFHNTLVFSHSANIRLLRSFFEYLNVPLWGSQMVHMHAMRDVAPLVTIMIQMYGTIHVKLPDFIIIATLNVTLRTGITQGQIVVMIMVSLNCNFFHGEWKIVSYDDSPCQISQSYEHPLKRYIVFINID